MQTNELFCSCYKEPVPLEKSWPFGISSRPSLKSVCCWGCRAVRYCIASKVVFYHLADFSKQKMQVIVIDFQLVANHVGSLLHFPDLFHHFYFPISRVVCVF